MARKIIGATVGTTMNPKKIANSTDNGEQIQRNTETISRLSSEKVDKTSASLGIASDGLIYLFIDGNPAGMGIPQGQSGDVFGYVDENNTIVLTGNLADGNYSIKYEIDNDSTVDIGAFTIGSAQTYTNLAKTVTEGKRLNSSAAVIDSSEHALVEDYIPFASGDVVRVKGLNVTHFSFYNSSKTSINSGPISFPYENGSKTISGAKGDDGIYTLTNISNAECKFIRIAGTLAGSTLDVIITLNETIN